LKIDLPLSIVIPRKTKADKVFHLNLNTYRNTYFMVLNQAKTLFKDTIVLPDDVLDSPPYKFTYTVYPANKRSFDIANVCSIVDKFCCDALVEAGLIKDDNHKHIPIVVYQIGHVDPDNPRCELEVEKIG